MVTQREWYSGTRASGSPNRSGWPADSSVGRERPFLPVLGALSPLAGGPLAHLRSGLFFLEGYSHVSCQADVGEIGHRAVADPGQAVIRTSNRVSGGSSHRSSEAAAIAPGLEGHDMVCLRAWSGSGSSASLCSPCPISSSRSLVRSSDMACTFAAPRCSIRSSAKGADGKAKPGQCIQGLGVVGDRPGPACG